MADPESTSAPEGTASAGSRFDRAGAVALIGGKIKESFTSILAKTYIGMFVTSIVVILGVVAPEGNNNENTYNYAYAVAVGSVAAFFALVGLWLVASEKGNKTVATAPMLGELNVNALLSIFLAGWWGVAVSLLTFRGPFLQTGNGYFATWAGFATSLVGIGATLPTLKQSASAASGSLLGLGTCAVVVGFELATGPITAGAFQQMIFGAVVSVMTFSIVLVIMLLELYQTPLEGPTRRALLMCVVVNWGITALWLTFTGPFMATGNGYFGLWVGLVCASVLVADVQSRFTAAIQNEAMFAIWGQFASGMVLLFAAMALDDATTRNWGYALSVGIVAGALSLAAAFFVHNPVGQRPLMTIRNHPITLSGLLAICLFLWWGVGAGVLTIDAPYKQTGNGFFASWMGFVCSIAGLGVTSASTRAAASSGYASQACMATCSLMLIAVAAPYAAEDSEVYRNHSGQIIYVFVVAGITLVRTLASVMMIAKGKTLGMMVEKILAATRLVKWTILAAWCTFSGPFEATGNGYFASWGGVICAVLLFINAWFPDLLARRDPAATRPEGEQQVNDDGEALNPSIVSADMAGNFDLESADKEPPGAPDDVQEE